jgi:hypothetical protein
MARRTRRGRSDHADPQENVLLGDGRAIEVGTTTQKEPVHLAGPLRNTLDRRQTMPTSRRTGDATVEPNASRPRTWLSMRLLQPIDRLLHDHEHVWTPRSRHSSSDGVVIYQRCACGLWRVTLDGPRPEAGRTLLTTGNPDAHNSPVRSPRPVPRATTTMTLMNEEARASVESSDDDDGHCANLHPRHGVP